MGDLLESGDKNIVENAPKKGRKHEEIKKYLIKSNTVKTIKQIIYFQVLPTGSASRTVSTLQHTVYESSQISGWVKKFIFPYRCRPRATPPPTPRCSPLFPTLPSSAWSAATVRRRLSTPMWRECSCPSPSPWMVPSTR